MDNILNLGEINFGGWLITGFIILIGITSIYKIIIEASVIFKKPIGIAKQRKADHELTIQNSKAIQELAKKHEVDTGHSIKNDEMIRDDLKKLTETVNSIAERLDIMQSKIDATEMAKLKDKILGYYRKYKEAGEWERFEADTFWGLYDRYIFHGGNTFVVRDIEPVMRNLKIID